MIPIALLNPPRRRRKNFWPDNFPGHSRAAKKGWRKHKRRYARNSGGHHMSRKRRFNLGRLLGMNPGSGFAGKITSGLDPRKLVATVPLVAGVIGNNLATSALTQKVLKFPIVQSGIGNYVLGLLTAQGLGWLGSYISKPFGHGIAVGGRVEVLGRALHDMWNKSSILEALKPNLSGFADIGVPGVWDQPRWNGFPYGREFRDPFATAGFQGMGDFVTPQKIQGAFPAQSSPMQYALPSAAAQAYHPGMPQMGEWNPDQQAAISDEIARAGG